LTCLKYLKTAGLEQLRQSVENNLDKYYNSYNWSDFFQTETYFREGRIEIAADLKNILQIPSDSNNYDHVNSINLYEALKNITPEQATDERISRDVMMNSFSFGSFRPASIRLLSSLETRIAIFSPSIE